MRITKDWRPPTADIPDSAGVYLFRDASGRVVYVGKAKSLKHRVPNYFGTGLHPRTASLLENAAEVEWIMTNNEVEALQLEVVLIKEHQPRFNVKYRDDKSYPYLTISFSEAIPRAKVTGPIAARVASMLRSMYGCSLSSTLGLTVRHCTNCG